MRNWFVWRGVNSLDMGIIVEALPQIPRATRNVTIITIPGRDGGLTMSDDSYGPVSLPIICGIKNTDMMLEQSEWLCGSGDLITSLNPSKKYKAQIDDGFVFERVGKRFRRFSVPFTARPFMYEAQPQTITLEESGTICNIGTRYSLPIIKVYGVTTLTVGDYELTIEATAGESYIYINSEIQECYYDKATGRNNKVAGVFPRIEPGECAVTLGMGITKVEIQGNWRWF